MARRDPDDPRILLARNADELAREIASSPLWKLITAQAADMRDAAMKSLATVDPTKAAEIARLQERFLLADTVQAWVKQAIDSGRAAESEIEDDKRDD